MRYMIWSTLLVLWLVPKSPTMAFSQFNAGFKKMYITEKTPLEFKQLIKETRCAICHDSTKKKPSGSLDKKFRNPYGQALDELLNKDDKKNKEKIYKALKTISSQKASNTDKTYGQLIKEYQLPYPQIEEVQYNNDW